MTTRKITFMALTAGIVGGIVLGTVATEGFNVYRQSQDSYRRSHDSQSFQQRVHCKAVADAYVKENTDLDDNGGKGRSVTLDKVDYSPARNSCVAELETTFYFKGGAPSFDSVQDLLSGETLFSVPITDGHVEALQPRFFPRVWDYVMNNASEPLELEKEWTLTMELMSPPKSASPSVTQWDAKGNPIPDSKHPPSGFIPDAPASQHKGNPWDRPKSAPPSGVAEPNDWAGGPHLNPPQNRVPHVSPLRHGFARFQTQQPAQGAHS